MHVSLGTTFASRLVLRVNSLENCEQPPLPREVGRSEAADPVSGALGAVGRGRAAEDSYLVDPASSHMLVSKIKPCMCKYKLFCTVKLRMAH